jgi:hypothetical protein
VVSLPALLYGNDSWTIKAKNINRMQLAEMRHLTAVKGCTRLYHMEWRYSKRSKSTVNIKSDGWVQEKLDKWSRQNDWWKNTDTDSTV